MTKYKTKGYKIEERAYKTVEVMGVFQQVRKTPDEIYADIKLHSPENLILAVDEYLMSHPGENIAKEDMCKALYGKYTTSLDRNIRDAVADLVTYLHRPYIATSHEKGYKNCTTAEECQPGIEDMARRISTSKLRLDGLREAQAVLKEKRMRIPKEQSFHPVQASLFG